EGAAGNQSAALARQYTNGWVVVNPAYNADGSARTSNATLTLGGTYSGSGLSSIGQVTLGPGTGVILASVSASSGLAGTTQGLGGQHGSLAIPQPAALLGTAAGTGTQAGTVSTPTLVTLQGSTAGRGTQIGNLTLPPPGNAGLSGTTTGRGVQSGN